MHMWWAAPGPVDYDTGTGSLGLDGLIYAIVLIGLFVTVVGFFTSRGERKQREKNKRP